MKKKTKLFLIFSAVVLLIVIAFCLIAKQQETQSKNLTKKIHKPYYSVSTELKPDSKTLNTKALNVSAKKKIEKIDLSDTKVANEDSLETNDAKLVQNNTETEVEEVRVSENKVENSEETESVVYDDCVGQFKIPAGNVDVTCYAGSSQDIVDRQNSAAYFYGYGHTVIADYYNQGFDGIKVCQEGTTATLTVDGEIREYQCVAKINGHNTGSGLTDANGTSIRELYPNTLVCYTCNGSWQNIVIVFFKLAGDDVVQSAEEDNGQDIAEDNTEDVLEEVPIYGCGEGNHIWGEWQVAWEVLEDDGDYYGWNKRFCKICDEEEWTPRTEPSE